MAKFVHDNALDALLAYIADGCNKMTVCAGQPTTYSDAVTALGSGSGKKLAEIAMTPGAGNGDFTIGNGDTNGRKLTVLQQTGISITVSGDGDHVALVDTGNSRLLLVTTMTLQALVSGNTMTVNAFDEEIADAA